MPEEQRSYQHSTERTRSENKSSRPGVGRATRGTGERSADRGCAPAECAKQRAERALIAEHQRDRAMSASRALRRRTCS
jgi:hypothetical protein